MKYIESNVPDGLRVHVRRFTQGGKYVTKCDLIATDEPDKGMVVCSGESSCHPKDNPNRKIGRAIAVGRALRTYHEGEPGSAARAEAGMRRVQEALFAS